jgi:hypothetical protein
MDKKLNIEFSKDKIEEFISIIISESEETKFEKQERIFTLQIT